MAIEIEDLNWLMSGGAYTLYLEFTAESAISFMDHKGVKTYFQNSFSFYKTAPRVLDLILY